MPKGGHARSGPAKVEGSRTSDRAGYSLTALPPAGFDGDAPEFPLPDALVRELEVWAEAWRSPMACVWISEPHRWRQVALWVRWSVRLEAEDASAALGQVVARFADDIGMSEAGRKFNGWKIAEPKPVSAAPDPVATVTSIKNRLNRGSA